MTTYVKCDSDLCSEQEAMPTGGWWTVGSPTPMGRIYSDEDELPLNKIRHFCSIACLSYWATKESDKRDRV